MMSVGEILVLHSIDTHIDRQVRASDRAEPAADAPLLLHHLGVKIPLRIDLLTHGDDFLRAGANTEFAALAFLGFNVD